MNDHLETSLNIAMIELAKQVTQLTSQVSSVVTEVALIKREKELDKIAMDRQSALNRWLIGTLAFIFMGILGITTTFMIFLANHVKWM